jgi:hypothetical protein
MIIWAAIFLFGLFAIPVGLIHIVLGAQRKEKKRILLGVVVPILLWIGIYALHEADRRFIERETQKNGGQTPDFIW